MFSSIFKGYAIFYSGKHRFPDRFDIRREMKDHARKHEVLRK
jgi:hypothetical protein